MFAHSFNYSHCDLISRAVYMYTQHTQWNFKCKKTTDIHIHFGKNEIITSYSECSSNTIIIPNKIGSTVATNHNFQLKNINVNSFTCSAYDIRWHKVRLISTDFIITFKFNRCCCCCCWWLLLLYVSFGCVRVHFRIIP